jgi:hypothetical protein
MRTGFLLGWLPLLVVLCCAQSLKLPVPPQQAADWQSSANVPTNILSAASAVFALGFPDPRGCEYREIQIVTSGVWGERGTNPTATRGWILPGDTAGARFAIAWNGLIYPVVNVGEPADLRAELLSLTAGRGTNRIFFSGLSDGAASESRSVFLAAAQSTRVLLLLRLGETAAALTNYSPLARLAPSFRPRGSPLSSTNTSDYDPYLQFAGDWAWALFDGVLSAHMRGDESFAYASAQVLAGVQPKIEAEAARRRFPRQPSYDSRQKDKERPYLTFLDQFPQLLTDLERREREGSRVSVMERGLTNIANQKARITALIRDLDLVQARQWGQPGGVNTGESPIVAALIHEGDAAVEPLLDCLETDKRLTRSVSFGRDFWRNRTVIPVTSAASMALHAILETNFRNAAEARAHWEKYGALKIEDRWYAILQDNAASMGHWLEAAGHVTKRQNPVPTNAPVQLRGEVLRGKSNPSVSELLARRAIEISPTNIAAYDLSAAGEMGLRLAAWDANAAMPVLKILAERSRAALEYSALPQRSGASPMGLLIARLSLARAEQGDAAAFGDYVAWLKTTRPEQLEYSLAESVAPLSRFPTNAILLTAADELFGDTNSTWGRLPWTRAGLFNPVESDLVRVPAFRRLLKRELDRKEVCGHVEWRAPNYVSFTLTNQARMNSGRSVVFPENEQPTDDATAELRWCDWITTSLSNGKQVPFFNPFAPIESRDQAIENAKDILSRAQAF